MSATSRSGASPFLADACRCLMQLAVRQCEPTPGVHARRRNEDNGQDKRQDWDDAKKRLRGALYTTFVRE